jgi:SRSO17 transposase
VAVFLTYASRGGHALIDRELYLPKSWTADPARCRAAGIPDGTAFATKPALARRMITHTLDAGVPASWVAGDEVYGADWTCTPAWKPARWVTCWAWRSITR